MRFHNRHSSASSLGRQAKVRLWRMLGMLVLVMIAIKVAGRSSFWAWMFPDADRGAASQPADVEPRSEKIDFGVKLDEDRQLRDGEFIARTVPDPADEAKESETAAEDSAEAESVQFEPDLFAPVSDNTLNVRYDERNAYYTVLARARDLTSDTLKKHADPDVSFYVLMTQPEQFRGRLLTVRGEIRRLLPFTAGENDQGIEDLWEAWLFTDDSGLNPYRIVCTEIPPGIPHGEELERAVPVRVTGFFFKKQGYSAQGGLHTAPLLLAKTIRWLPPPPVSDQPESAAGLWIVGTVCLTACLLVFTCWRVASGDRAAHARSFHHYYEPRPESLEALKSLDTIEESDIVRHLSEVGDQSDADESTSAKPEETGA